MKLNRVGRVERLIESLRDGDVSRITRGYPKYTAFYQSLDTYYYHAHNQNWKKALKAMADFIEEAMEGQDDSP